MTDKKYPIAEMFTSPQGEGLYAGVLMQFVRIGGCSVGKRMTETEREHFSELEGQPINLYREKCTLYDGREFACDTDFKTKKVLTAVEIVQSTPKGVSHICLTGGEPLDHPIEEMVDFFIDFGFEVHIETSGTVNITERALPNWEIEDSILNGGYLWVTVSPKSGVLPSMISAADEIKLLIDDHFDISKVPNDILNHPLVYIQPVNYENDLNIVNMNLCLELQKEIPTWRISSQSHKLWKVR